MVPLIERIQLDEPLGEGYWPTEILAEIERWQGVRDELKTGENGHIQLVNTDPELRGKSLSYVEALSYPNGLQLAQLVPGSLRDFGKLNELQVAKAAFDSRMEIGEEKVFIDAWGLFINSDAVKITIGVINGDKLMEEERAAIAAALLVRHESRMWMQQGLILANAPKQANSVRGIFGSEVWGVLVPDKDGVLRVGDVKQVLLDKFLDKPDRNPEKPFVVFERSGR